MRRTRLILAFLLFLTALLLKPANANKNNEHFAWRKPPTIVVCFQKFPTHLLFRAIDFWEIRGQKFEGVIVDTPSAICNVDHVPDTIIVRRAPKGKLKIGQLAITERRSDLENNMISSVVWFDPIRLRDPWVIEHELGHGLGFGHVPEKNHIMNPWSPHMGPEFSIR